MSHEPPEVVDDFHANAVVAAVDLLGMGRLLAQDDQALAAMDAIDLLVCNTTSQDVYQNPKLQSEFKPMYVYRAYFGDSAYLFADPTRSVAEQTTNLLVKCASLISQGLEHWITGDSHQFLARVGIAFGNVRWRRIGWLGENILIPMGTAMERAYRLSRRQDWIGGAVDRQLKSINDRYRLEYDVPTHDADGEVDAINWVQFMEDDAELPDFLNAFEAKGAKGLPEDQSIRRKHAATQAFIAEARTRMVAAL
jgi:hypothetical protein